MAAYRFIANIKLFRWHTLMFSYSLLWLVKLNSYCQTNTPSHVYHSVYQYNLKLDFLSLVFWGSNIKMCVYRDRMRRTVRDLWKGCTVNKAMGSSFPLALCPLTSSSKSIPTGQTSGSDALTLNFAASETISCTQDSVEDTEKPEGSKK